MLLTTSVYGVVRFWIKKTMMAKKEGGKKRKIKDERTKSHELSERKKLMIRTTCLFFSILVSYELTMRYGMEVIPRFAYDSLVMFLILYMSKSSDDRTNKDATDALFRNSPVNKSDVKKITLDRPTRKRSLRAL